MTTPSSVERAKRGPLTCACRRRSSDVVLGTVSTTKEFLISPSRQRFGRSARYNQLRVRAPGATSVRPFRMSQRRCLRHELAALACHSSRGFQTELFLNGPCQICNLGTENRQQIIHGDDSEKVAMFIDYPK